MLAFGIVLTTLGSVLPSVIERFGIDKAIAGSLLLLLTFAILVGSLVFGPIVDRNGYKGLLLVATVFVVVGLEGIAFAPSLSSLRVSIAIVGFGGGIVNGGSNALVADISTESRGAGLSFLGAFFGLGAVGVPFALSNLLDVFSYASIIAAVGALVIVPLVMTALATFPLPKQSQGSPFAHAGALLREAPLIVMGLMLFLESGMEITVGGWTATYFKESLGLADQRALLCLSLFWLGMTLARLTLGTLAARPAPIAILIGSIATAFIGALLLVQSRSASLAATAVFLLGAGFAAVFPVVLGLVGDRYARLSGTAFSVAMVMALSGGMTFSYLTGFLGDAFGLRGSFMVVPVALALLTTLLMVLRRVESSGQNRRR